MEFFFSIFSISSIICFGTTDIRHKWTILNSANIFKILFYPQKSNSTWAIFWERFECLILRLITFFHVELINVWKMNSEDLDGIYFYVNIIYTTDYHFYPFQGSNSSNLTLRKVWLKTRIFQTIRNQTRNFLTESKFLRKIVESLAYAI